MHTRTRPTGILLLGHPGDMLLEIVGKQVPLPLTEGEWVRCARHLRRLLDRRLPKDADQEAWLGQALKSIQERLGGRLAVTTTAEIAESVYNLGAR